MWQYQKLSMFLALGMVAISSSTGCATNVEDPVVDEEAMSADDTAESSEALTAGDSWGRGGYRGYGRYGYGRGFRRGFYGHGGYGYGGYGYGGYGRGYGDWGNDQDVAIVINNNGYDGPGDYVDYDDYLEFDDCGDDGFLDDDWN